MRTALLVMFIGVANSVWAAGGDSDRGMSPLTRDMGTNIALSCTYTWSMEPNAFPDGYNGHDMCKDPGDTVQLTDGELATRCWWDRRTVGWWFESKPLILTIDLEREQPIDAVEFHLSSEVTGMRVPVLTGLFVSNDNQTFLPVGEIDKPEALRQWRRSKIAGEQDDNPHAWIGITNLQTKGRFLVVSLESANLYLDEIRVFSGRLKAGDVKLDQTALRSHVMLHPFFKKRRAYVATDVLTPIELLSVEAGGSPIPADIYLDLPQGLTLVAPIAKADPVSVRWRDQDYSRFALPRAERLYISSTRAPGVVDQIRLTGMASCTNYAGFEQEVEVETIHIPEAPNFKNLIACVPMDISYSLGWPDVTKHYRRLGLNLFMPFGHTDYYYRLLVNDRAPAQGLIAAGQKAGLRIGGSFSPFCNVAIPQSRPAVFLSGRASANGCPRGYLEALDAPMPAQRDEVAQVSAGAAAGLDFFTFDSEPYWPGEICTCAVCEQAWQDYLKQEAPDLPLLTQQEVAKDRVKYAHYLPLMQQFWDAFYIRLWGRFREAMEQASGGKHAIEIVLYGNPGGEKDALGLQTHFGNGGRFLPLYNAGVINGANPSWYQALTDQLGDAYVRPVREALPPTCPQYVWVTSGGSSLAYERTPADFKNRLLELFLNGAHGFFVWSSFGMDAADYRAVAEVVRQIQPVEQFVTHGRLLPLDAFDAPEGMRVRGLQLGMEAIILVSRYNRDDAADVTLTLRLPAETLPSRLAQPLEGGPALKFVDRQLHIHFSGSEDQWVQTFRLHP